MRAGKLLLHIQITVESTWLFCQAWKPDLLRISPVADTLQEIQKKNVDCIQTSESVQLLELHNKDPKHWELVKAEFVEY